MSIACIPATSGIQKKWTIYQNSLDFIPLTQVSNLVYESIRTQNGVLKYQVKKEKC